MFIIVFAWGRIDPNGKETLFYGLWSYYREIGIIFSLLLGKDDDD